MYIIIIEENIQNIVTNRERISLNSKKLSLANFLII